MIKRFKYILLTTALATTLFATSGCDMFTKKNDGHVDLSWYANITYEDAVGNEFSKADEMSYKPVAVAANSEYEAEVGMEENGEYFLNINTVAKNIDERFFFDDNENILFTNATSTSVVNIAANTLDGQPLDYTAAVVDKKKCYVNLKLIEHFVEFKYKTGKLSDEYNLISFDRTEGEYQVATVNDDTEMRTNGDYQNLIVTEIEEDAKVQVIEKGENWTKAKTENGFIGFIPTSDLEKFEKKTRTNQNDDDTYTHITMDEKVSLGWNQIGGYLGNNSVGKTLSRVKGLNVISPTWFALSDKNGNITDLSSPDYVKTAHAKGVQVWALVNDFGGKKLSKQVVNSTSARTNLINNLMYFVDQNNLDGLNVDFEYVSTASAKGYLQFLRELSVACRNKGIVLSIDDYVPSTWSVIYDRKQQYKLADYIIVMNYDEHTAGSDQAGSVSSMGFAKKALEDTIAETGGSERVINGMPFYTRVWIETPEADSDGSGKLIEDSVNGNYYLESQAITMDTANDLIKDGGVKPTFNEEAGQNFVCFEKDKSTYMIWVEDKTSVEARLGLIDQYNLGGAAYWALGQETDNIWNVIAKYFGK